MTIMRTKHTRVYKIHFLVWMSTSCFTDFWVIVLNIQFLKKHVTKHLEEINKYRRTKRVLTANRQDTQEQCREMMRVR